jgi:hypothetical protein
MSRFLVEFSKLEKLGLCGREEREKQAWTVFSMNIHHNLMGVGSFDCVDKVESFHEIDKSGKLGGDSGWMWIKNELECSQKFSKWFRGIDDEV